MPLSLKCKTIDYASRDEWQAASKHFIGASDTSVVLGTSRWDGRYSLWAKKRGMIERDQAETIRMRRGHAMEPLIGELTEEYTGREVFHESQMRRRVHTAFTFIACTLDFTVIDTLKGQGVCEGKNVDRSKADDLEELIAKEFRPQVQHQLFVTGLPWGMIAILCGDEFLWCDVERDDDFIDNTLIPKLCRFWAHVQTGIPPAPDGHPSTAKAIGSAHPLEDGSTIALPGEFYDLDLELLETKRDIDRLCYRKSEIENLIKATMGESSYGLIPGVARYSWNTQGTAGGGYSRVLRRKAV